MEDIQQLSIKYIFSEERVRLLICTKINKDNVTSMFSKN